MELDPVDIRILQLLQRDARMTTKDIAGRLDKAVTSVHERIKKLEERGYITAYVALLDKHRIGKKLTGYTTVKLKEHSESVLTGFEKAMVKFPEIMECYQLTGLSDFLIKVVIEDMEAYNDFLKNKLAKLPHIGNVHTSFVLSEAKRETAYHLSLPEEVKKKKRG